MKIGIDFDNTIARYGKLFNKIAIKNNFLSKDFLFEEKECIRKSILEKKNGKSTWMKLQGLVYGKHMLKAQINPGVINFLYGCKIRNIQVFIVSHKTKFGHFDEKKYH